MNGFSSAPALRTPLPAAAALVLGYLLAGFAALALALPPDTEIAVWPAAGVAVGGLLVGGLRLWPVVWFGSFLVNLYLRLGPLGLPPTPSAFLLLPSR